jgi:membrane protein
VHPLSRRLIDRAPPGLRTPVSLTVRTVDGALAHRLPGLAAEVAFWVLLSLPALLLTTVATTGVLGGEAGDWKDDLISWIVDVAGLALTSRTIEEGLRPLLESLLQDGGVAIVSFAFITTVWVASRAVRVILTTIELTADVIDPRPGWKQRLLGFGLTLGALLSGVVITPLLLAGPGFGEQLADLLEPELAFVEPLWRAAYWPATVALAVVGLSVLYHLGVPGRSPWRRDVPGAVLATLVWLLGSGGLRLYGSWVLDGEGAYGPLAGPIVALLWIWVTGFAVLLGAEFNAQVERRWPTGPDSGVVEASSAGG